MISGQLFVREAGKREGRRLAIVAGIIALPDDAPVKGEHQYVSVGYVEDGMLDDVVVLKLLTHSAADLTERARGEGIDGLLRAPIWRTL